MPPKQDKEIKIGLLKDPKQEEDYNKFSLYQKHGHQNENSAFSWFHRVREMYPTSFIFQVIIQFLNEGMMVMRMLLMKDLFINYYKVFLNQTSIYNSMIFSPWLFKMLMGILVDTRLIAKRKYYLIGCGFICTILQLFVARSSPTTVSHQNIATCLIIYNVFAAMLDVTIESIVIQQARKDPEFGQQNIKSLSFVSFAVGVVVGASISAVVTQYYNPFLGFYFASIMSAFIGISACFISDEIETNQYALLAIEMEKKEEVIYMQEKGEEQHV
jgi:MFS family permease